MIRIQGCSDAQAVDEKSRTGRPTNSSAERILPVHDTSRSGSPPNQTLDSTASRASTATITTTTIHGNRPTSTSDSTIAMIANRSAIGSSALPSFEPWSNLRAMNPSAQSDTPSTTSDRSAHPGCPCTTSTT
ncbi:hypothetical protein ASG04_04145 [Curtobacterium sp. Leaf183]|nr:hypothetical protein ASG04_04145 [Curtobacterium sp. Leaf183]